MTRAREILGTLALLLAGILVALAAGEVWARWLREVPDRPPPPASAASPELAHLPELHSGRELIRPNVRGRYAGVVHRTNRWGLRGPDVPRRKPPGTLRIALIGDSVAMGMGVPYAQTYGARVARSLSGSDWVGGRRVEVLNLGVAGFNGAQSVERLKTVGAPLGPDLVIYGYTLNDIQGPAWREPPPGYLAMRRARRAASARSPFHLWRVVEPRLASLRELVAPPPGSFVWALDENYFRNPAAWSGLVAVLGDLAEGQRALGACAHLLLHTRLQFLHPFHPFRRHYDAVARAARERGLSVTASLPWFLEEDGPATALWVAADDAHPNARGHALLAEALVEGLRRDLPERCRP